MSRSNDPNDYVVHDPLLEKGKEKFNRMQAKEKRKQREWAGKSLTWSLKSVIWLNVALKTTTKSLRQMQHNDSTRFCLVSLVIRAKSMQKTMWRISRHSWWSVFFCLCSKVLALLLSGQEHVVNVYICPVGIPFWQLDVHGEFIHRPSIIFLFLQLSLMWTAPATLRRLWKLSLREGELRASLMIAEIDL